MRQTLFLILDYINVAYIQFKKALFNIYKQLADLEIEDVGNQVGTIRWVLAGQEVIDNIESAGVSYKDNKEGRASKMAYDCH